MTYLDGIQYEAAQTPGVGKYNTRTRVIIILFSQNPVLFIIEKETNPNNGGKSMKKLAKKRRKKRLSPTWELTTQKK